MKEKYIYIIASIFVLLCFIPVIVVLSNQDNIRYVPLVERLENAMEDSYAPFCMKFEGQSATYITHYSILFINADGNRKQIGFDDYTDLGNKIYLPEYYIYDEIPLQIRAKLIDSELTIDKNNILHFCDEYNYYKNKARGN